MKVLQVTYFAQVVTDSPVEKVSALLDGAFKNDIAALPWPGYDERPEVNFAVGYADNALLIKFYVREQYLQAVYRRTNEPVHKDSCVEFFIAFGTDETYYNLEFNSV